MLPGGDGLENCGCGFGKITAFLTGKTKNSRVQNRLGFGAGKHIGKLGHFWTLAARTALEDWSRKNTAQ